MSPVGRQGLPLQRTTVALPNALSTVELLPLVRTMLLTGLAELIRTLAPRPRSAAMPSPQLIGGRPRVSMTMWNEVPGPELTDLRVSELMSCALSPLPYAAEAEHPRFRHAQLFPVLVPYRVL